MARPAGHSPKQTPYPRTYPDGRKVWVARYYDSGKARYAKPRWHGYKSTFYRKRDAQRAIDEALEQLRGGPDSPQTVREYSRSWPWRHSRSERTNKTNADRISTVLDVVVESRPLGEWRFDELRRRHVLALLDHMLSVEGRAARGAKAILAAFSTMAEDAIGDDVALRNAFVGVRVRAGDPRVRKPQRRIRIWSFADMLDFAAAGRAEVRARTRRPVEGRRPARPRFYPARDYQAMLLTPGFTGLRLGELLALKEDEFDGRTFQLHNAAHEGILLPSSRQKNHERTVPVPPTLARLISERVGLGESEFLFPTPTGKLWRERNFYRDVWLPARVASGLDPTPHEFRHSYITNLRAAGVDDADLAQIAGHGVQTLVTVYTHALGKSHGRVREIIG